MFQKINSVYYLIILKNFLPLLFLIVEMVASHSKARWEENSGHSVHSAIPALKAASIQVQTSI